MVVGTSDTNPRNATAAVAVNVQKDSNQVECILILIPSVAVAAIRDKLFAEGLASSECAHCLIFFSLHHIHFP
jgi:hypothetical protein